MRRKLEQCLEETPPGQDFFWIYQKAVLLELLERGLLDQAQYEFCIRILAKAVK